MTVPASTENCGLPSCYSYVNGEWSACSATCGPDVQRTRIVECIDQRTVSSVDAANCDGDAPASSEACNGLPVTCIVYTYSYSAWSSCSESCGDNAVRTRTATCVAGGTSNAVDDAECIAQGVVKSSTEENCLNAGLVALCPFYGFSFGEFGDCSVTCGTGQRVRTVTCMDIFEDVEVDISLCPGSVPASTATCELDTCTTYQYFVSGWTVCDCGTLMHSRAVLCVEVVTNGAPINKEDSVCTAEGIVKPADIEACVPEQGACEGNWMTGDWSECSVTCADGTQTRNVYCTDKFDATLTVVDIQCNPDTKPDSEQACTLDPCPVYNYQYYVSTWDDCSATCDEGTQTRVVLCTEFVDDVLTMSVADTFCAGMERPSESQTCNLVACQGTYYAGDWGTCSVTCGCGVQTRVVVCRLSKDNALTTVAEDRCPDTKPSFEQECRNAACPEPFDCGTTYSQASGVIYSPQYPIGYPNDLDCTVTIDLAADVIANAGSLIQITITQFQLEDEANCKFDKLEIQDGANIETLCGSLDTLPYVITASSSTISLNLHTDATITGGGYIITYAAVQPAPAP